MDRVDLYVVAGPSNTFMGGRHVPGGFDYLSKNLFLLARLNPTTFFNVHVAHSVYHGRLGTFPNELNLKVEVRIFDNIDIDGLESMDQAFQHGTLLNKLFNVVPPTERFLIIMDPDCYTLKKDLIQSLIKEINSGEYVFGGLPYPSWYPKEYTWRTPQLYFGFFDRNQFDPTGLDFRAGGELDSELPNTSSRESFSLRAARRIKSLVLRLNFACDNSIVPVLLENNISRYQKRYLINPYDTAWRLGAEIEHLGVQVKIYPNILKTETKICGFNSREYLINNPDLSHLEGFLGWHFASQGLFEGREIGSQKILVNVLKLFFGGEPISREKWPSTSLISSQNIENYKLFEFIKGQIPAADFYAVNQELSFFHLGSKGKGRVTKEIQILDLIIKKILTSQKSKEFED